MDMYKLYADSEYAPYPASRAIIDCDALFGNYVLLQRIARQSNENAEIICVVKSDAYGHSCEICAPVLAGAGCRRFAVATLSEAVALRKTLNSHGIGDAVILILGYTPPQNAPLLSEHNITQTVFSAEYARELERFAVGNIGVHIKLDTGMGRLGYLVRRTEDIDIAVRQILELKTLTLLRPEGIFTHFFVSDEETGADQTRAQFELFDAVCRKLKEQNFDYGFRHVCNSAGFVRFPEYVCDGVRLGIVLYGGGIHIDGIRPVMTFECTVSHIKTLRAGESLGYGGAFTAPRDMRVATLTVGYADGFRRTYSGCSVKIEGEHGSTEARIIGRVCMDQCMADIGDADVRPGDRAIIFGDGRERLDELSKMSGTIDYECLCAVSARVPRIIKNSGGRNET